MSNQAPIPIVVEQYRTKLEKIMLELPEENSFDFHRQYLAGYIDCLCEMNHIPPEVQEILYAEYAS